MKGRAVVARRVVSASCLCLCVAVAPALAQEAGAAVYLALRASPRAQVVVSLREPNHRARYLSQTVQEIGDTRRSVLAGLEPQEFVVTHEWLAVSALAGQITESGLRKILAHPDVLRVDLDVPVYAALAESVALVGAEQLHNQGVTGRGVTVAVLDTGADANHPDLKSSIVDEHCFCTSADGSGCCPNGSKEQSGPGASKDEQGHGTNVTGIITSDGRVAPPGMAPDADVVSIRVLDKAGVAASTAQIISGLDYVITKRPEVKVVNLSLGTANLFAGTCDNAASFTQAFTSAINTLRARGVLTFSATANNGSASQIALPACVSTAVAVGATYDGNVGTVNFGCTDATTSADRVPCFSNSSSKVDLLAPGAAITSTGIGGGTSTFLGTSQACPHAAGAAALLLSAKPGLSADQVQNVLKNTGVNVTDPKNGITSRRIDLKAALSAASLEFKPGPIE